MEQKRVKTSVVVSVCGLFAALSIVVMLLAHVGVLTYAVPALAGALLVIIYLELGVKNAFTVYLAVSVLSFLISPLLHIFLRLLSRFKSVYRENSKENFAMDCKNLAFYSFIFFGDFFVCLCVWYSAR